MGDLAAAGAAAAASDVCARECAACTCFEVLTPSPVSRSAGLAAALRWSEGLMERGGTMAAPRGLLLMRRGGGGLGCTGIAAGCRCAPECVKCPCATAAAVWGWCTPECAACT